MQTSSSVDWRGMVLGLGLVLMLVMPSRAFAQLAVSQTPIAGPALGAVVRGATATTFSISSAGAVTRASGDAIRLSTGGVTAPAFSVSCGFLNLSALCAIRTVRITVQPAAGANVKVTNFKINSISGASFAAGAAPAPASSLTFDITPLGLFGTATFTLAMDVWVAGGATSGQYDFDYTVTAIFV